MMHLNSLNFLSGGAGTWFLRLGLEPRYEGYHLSLEILSSEAINDYSCKVGYAPALDRDAAPGARNARDLCAHYAAARSHQGCYTTLVGAKLRFL
jgi:hypothetical protein